jgi:hypothetical protein
MRKKYSNKIWRNFYILLSATALLIGCNITRPSTRESKEILQFLIDMSGIPAEIISLRQLDSHIDIENQVKFLTIKFNVKIKYTEDYNPCHECSDQSSLQMKPFLLLIDSNAVKGEEREGEDKVTFEWTGKGWMGENGKIYY